MIERKITLTDIINGETETCRITHSTLKNCHENVPKAINVLLQLMYFTGSNKDVTTPQGEFHSYVWHQYMEAPYSFRACYLLYERGHYLTAVIIFRSLLESFVQCRFAFNHKDMVRVIWSGQKCAIKGKKKKITFKEMFDEISPGYYEKNYGKQLSGFAHGKIGTDIFRVKRKSESVGEVTAVPEFDENLASYVINQVIALQLGYLNFFPKFFPDGFNSITKDFAEEYNCLKKWLYEHLNSHRRINLPSSEWHKHMDAFMGIPIAQ